MTTTIDLLALIDPVVDEILTVFDIDRPPVPVELMLQRPREGMWKEIDLSEMSATFLNLHDRHAPRMSAVRLLARNIARSEWGEVRGLSAALESAEHVNIMARAIIIPRSFLEKMDREFYDRETLSLKFEVPEGDAQARLHDLGYEE